MMDWNGKRYWLVGASEGLGREMAKEICSRGAHVVVSARTESRLIELCRDLTSESSALAFDVTSSEQVLAAAKQVGEVDGIIYAAGAYTPMESAKWDGPEAELIADVNFMGALRVLSSVVPMFCKRDKGHIVLIGSLAGYRGLPKAIGYGASKAAAMHLGENLQADLRRTNVKVQVLNPGFIETRLTEKNDFKMPFLMTPKDAARTAVDKMERSGFSYDFPALFSWVFKVGAILPNFLYFRIFGS